MSFSDAASSGGLGFGLQLQGGEHSDGLAEAGGTAKLPGRILLVEDEQPFRELLQAFLESQGFRVDAVRDGRCGARWLEANAADLVMTDLCMPEVDGMELLMTIRRLRPNLPVVVMSGGVAGQMIGMLKAAELPARAHARETFLAAAAGDGGP